MGSSIRKIYEDYETYESMCKVLGVQPLGIREEPGEGKLDWYDQMRAWIKEAGVSTEYEWFRKMENQNEKD